MITRSPLSPQDWVDRYWSGPTLDKEFHDTQVVYAYINHGKWIIECPSPGSSCSAAILGHPDMPEFFCPSCGNAVWDGKWLHVVFPDETTVHQIEALLSVRPDITSRNWVPPETVDDLKLENKVNGLG